MVTLVGEIKSNKLNYSTMLSDFLNKSKSIILNSRLEGAIGLTKEVKEILTSGNFSHL
jgi:hypothetical protein